MLKNYYQAKIFPQAIEIFKKLIEDTLSAGEKNNIFVISYSLAYAQHQLAKIDKNTSLLNEVIGDLKQVESNMRLASKSGTDLFKKVSRLSEDCQKLKETFQSAELS